jgi:hypothetical protein
MRRSSSRGLLVLLIPLIAPGLERTVKADPIGYLSSGDIGNASGAPIGNFAITPTNGTLLDPGTFALATFQAEVLPSGAGLTYTNMPFYINVSVSSESPNSSVAPSGLSIEGVLNGTVTGSNASDVVATVTSIQSIGPNPLPFSLNSFSVLGPLTLAPGGVDGGTTTLMGQITDQSVPEPTPLAMMALLAIGAGLRLGMRRIKSRSR